MTPEDDEETMFYDRLQPYVRPNGRVTPCESLEVGDTDVQ
eukprot:CAMPEP_0175857632 /NCGR_PEP_ID=MMETSP0107_2-20121207/29200_1 /TAXON_ID=195067 ORGANISM="Goniomonas pacifica, Strain CCMP1869" /NCGR_SAMPLE_ID=MMETSP0107_2 /ASSEMBLY_ACC=CAM_ASM_000203 /LENGTH=39 /DNA_ID= /DNA_START= /DNA_END= /DNA_ORIENTATION=